jgi:hypothetical protein
MALSFLILTVIVAADVLLSSPIFEIFEDFDTAVNISLLF